MGVLKLNTQNSSINHTANSKFFLLRIKWIKKFITQRHTQALVLPGIIFMIIFCYLPMYGIIISFKNYDVVKGIMGSPWVGLEQFKDFFSEGRFLLIMRNTLGIGIISVFAGFPIPIIFALLLNEMKNLKFKKFVQTVSYLPYFISWVVISGMFLSWLSSEGMINEMLLRFHFVTNPVEFMSDQKYFWPILIITNIWKNFGYWAIIYLAAIASIDQEMYEAGIVDGATRLQRIFYITLPSMKTVIAITFIFAMSGIISSNFDQIFVMRNNLVSDVSDVIDTYTFDMGITQARYSFATAIGLFKSVVALILLLITNYSAKKLSDSSLF